MAKTPRASKASDAKASSKTKPAKQTAAKQAAPAEDATAPAKGSKKKAAATKKKAAEAAPAPAPKKATKKRAAAAPAPKKASKKKAAEAEAAPAPAAKKATKKRAAAEAAPAAKKTSKKKAAAAEAPVSQQLALDIDVRAPSVAPAAKKPLQPGDRIPDFSLEGDDGQTYSRQSLAGGRFVIYFYPKDDTPGCTREACDFRDHRPRLDAAGVKVLGVSGDSLKSHGRFRSKYELTFPLLADPDRAVAQAFGAVGEKKLYGKTSIGIIRSTFLVGPDGIVEKTFSPVKVDGHAAAVLQAIGSG